MSNDKKFENIVWNSTNCSKTDNTTVLTGETIYIRTNTTSPPNSILVSNYGKVFIYSLWYHNSCLYMYMKHRTFAGKATRYTWQCVELSWLVSSFTCYISPQKGNSLQEIEMKHFKPNVFLCPMWFNKNTSWKFKIFERITEKSNLKLIAVMCKHFTMKKI